MPRLPRTMTEVQTNSSALQGLMCLLLLTVCLALWKICSKVWMKVWRNFQVLSMDLPTVCGHLPQGVGGVAPLPASLLYSMPVPSCSVFPSVKVALPELPAIAGIALPMLVFVIVVVPTLPVPDNKPIRSVLLCALMAQATHLPPVVLPLTLCRCRAHHALRNPVLLHLLCLLHLLPVVRPLVLVQSLAKNHLSHAALTSLLLMLCRCLQLLHVWLSNLCSLSIRLVVHPFA